MSTGSTVHGLENGEFFLVLLLVLGGASTAASGEGWGFLGRWEDAVAAPLSLSWAVMWELHPVPSTVTAFARASGSALSTWNCGCGPVPVLASILPPFHIQCTLLPFYRCVVF